MLYDTAQIGIEVAVPQLSTAFLEEREVQEGCRKDVVIWAEPKMTVWDSDFKSCREPLSVTLWKVINQGDRKSQQAIKQAEHIADDEWLEKSRRASGFTGYGFNLNKNSLVNSSAKTSRPIEITSLV